MDDGVPTGFAAMAAARAEVTMQPVDDPFDRSFQRGLAGLLALAIIFVAGDLLPLTSGDDLRAIPAVQWAYAIGACIALSFLIDIWTTWSAGREGN